MSNHIEDLQILANDAHKQYLATWTIMTEMAENDGRLSDSSAEKLIDAVQALASNQSHLCDILAKMQETKMKEDTTPNE